MGQRSPRVGCKAAEARACPSFCRPGWVVSGAAAGHFKFPSAEDCLDVEQHTKAPKGYLAWHEWARAKSKTHRQVRCPTCGFFSIWKPRKKRGPSGGR